MPGSTAGRPQGRIEIKKFLDSEKGQAYFQGLLGSLLITFKTQAFVSLPFGGVHSFVQVALY